MSIDSNLQTWASMIIYDELKKNCEMLKLDDEDRKVYEMCMVDFGTYVNYLKRNHMCIEESNVSQLECTMMSDGYGLKMVEVKVKGEKIEEIEEVIRLFVRQWWKKYHVRVKIVFNVSETAPRYTFGGIPPTNFTQKEVNEMISILSDVLVKNGEIICPSILADQLFRRYVNNIGRKKWTNEDKIQLISVLTREARRIAFSHGPTIFLKPDKRLFLREFRDDDNNNHIV